MNTLDALAFVCPLTPWKAEALRCWGEEMLVLGPYRREYQAFRRRLCLTAHRMYLQHTPRGERVIMYLEGDDLQWMFQQLRTSQDPFVVWFRQRARDVLDGLDSTQTEPGSLSRLVFAGPCMEEDEARSCALKEMERLSLTSPRK